jgi:1-acyl-sn-glycerol-3-phosphate acyltransferase
MAGFRERLSYACSLGITAPLVFIATGIMGSLSLASSLIDSSGNVQHACARLWARLVLAICRVQLTVTGRIPFEHNVPYVFFVNHQSHMDIPIMLAALPISFRFAAKKELFRIPFLGWHLRRSGHIPVDRKNPHAAVKSFRSAGNRLRAGTSLVFFPEGATSLDGVIKPFKSGGFVLAEQSQAEVVPVTICGSRAVLVPKTYHVRGGPVEVTLGQPISTKGFSQQELNARVRAEILTTFEHGKTLDRNTDTISR